MQLDITEELCVIVLVKGTTEGAKLHEVTSKVVQSTETSWAMVDGAPGTGWQVQLWSKYVHNLKIRTLIISGNERENFS